MSEREKALEAALAIISDWEDQARERDVHDPMRATILAEAAIIRSALAMPATVDRASWEAGRDAAAATAYRICAETRHVTLGQKCHDAIHNLTPPEDAPATVDRAGWQPIETAPKDNTRVLLFAKHRKICLGEYVDGDPDFTWALKGWKNTNGNFFCPSHWMPLPEAPEDAP